MVVQDLGFAFRLGVEFAMQFAEGIRHDPAWRKCTMVLQERQLWSAH